MTPQLLDDVDARVGVIGAGITGLALTHYLVERGVESVAVESTGSAGGVVRTTTQDGRVLEHGPQRLRLTAAVRELVEAAGIGGEVIEAPDVPLFVYARGDLRRVPRSISSFLTTDLLSTRAKARVLLEPLTARGRPGETAAELFSRKFGRTAYENVIGPLFGGIYGSDPAEMPARHALSGLLSLEDREGSLLRPALRRARSGESAPAASFEGGLQSLPAALADRYGDRIRLDTPATAIRARDDGAYAIEADGETITVEHLVVTTPADAAAVLLEDVADGADRLRTLNYNPLAIVHLVADLDVEGYGYQVRAGEELATLGVSWNASLFDRDGVYTSFLGGMRAPDLVDRPPDELGEIARQEFRAVTGVDAEVVNVTRLPRGFPAWDRSWAALDDLTLPADVHLATNYAGRMGIPSRVREAKTLASEFAD